MKKEKDLELEKVKFGKRVLKIYLVISILISLVFLLCLAGVIIVGAKGNTAELLESVKMSYPILLAFIIFFTLLYILQTVLIIRALKNPKKSTLLLIITCLVLVGDIINLFINGAGPYNATIIWDIALICGIMFIRNSIKEKN